jgi:hypothetical protein
MLLHPDSPDHVRALTREILADPAFAPRQTFLQWVSERFSGLSAPDIPWNSTLAHVVWWGVIIWCTLTVIAIAAHVAWTARQGLPRGKAVRVQGLDQASPAPEPLSFRQLTEQICRYGEAGSFAEAVPLMMRALLRRLTEQGLLHEQPGKTNGDYLRELPSSAQGGAAFRAFVAECERFVYGGRPCRMESFQHLHRLYLQVLADVEPLA